MYSAPLRSVQMFLHAIEHVWQPMHLSRWNRITSYNVCYTKLLRADLGVELHAHTELLKVEPPAERQGGIKVASVEELVEKLKNEAKVI